MKLYFAGPSVFLKNGQSEITGNFIKNLALLYGATGFYPGDFSSTDPGKIYDNCVSNLFDSNAIIADIGSWRGAEMDVGTAVEIGIAIGKNIPIYGYAEDWDIPLVDKLPPSVDYDTENFGFPQNLMVIFSCVEIFETAEEAVKAATKRR
jgi:nucleoside 2-deoxyribosyltransferase